MSDHRLPPAEGEWIDRSRTLRFSFEGREYTGFVGDTLSSALHASGLKMLGRSFKYHRPRGIYSMANHDVNNMFTDGKTPNIRADVTPITEGAQYRAVNTLGGLTGDRARFFELLSPFLPVGFYYKAFHTPRKLFPFWEQQMRDMAGLGSILPELKRIRTPKSYSFCDVLVIGAGPSGLSAAIAAAENGAKVIVVDENPRAGGSLGYQWNSEPESGALLKDLLQKVAASKNIDLRLSTVAAGCYADKWVALVDEKRLSKARAGSIIFATGAFEQPAVFHNNDLPGVMLASGAQRLMQRYRVRPFKRGVVLTANADGYRAALDLHASGVSVAAIVDMGDPAEKAPWSERVQKLGIPIHARHVVYEASAASGKTGIRAAVIRELDDAGCASCAKKAIECDGMAVSVGWAPTDGLFCQSGGKLAYSQELQQVVPTVIPEGIFACGRMNGIYGLREQLADGTHAGEAAAKHLGLRATEPAPAAARKGPAPSHPFPVVDHPKAKNFVDLDEDIQVKDITNSVQEGFDNVELLKRYSTFGMGPSQGKISNTNSVRILAKTLKQPIEKLSNPTSRPFFHPVPMSHLGGRGFDPHRYTALHSWHVQRDAKFMPAGVWLRPAYYGASKKSREQAIREEVNAVRTRVGLIDVSTLGKLEISGPDAAKFIERIYTARFAKMKNGTTRYAVMCDETGVLIDDGVAGRIADDRFYVTCTTTGADAVYREMQRWALIWGMKVVLANTTGTYAAMNLAGPASRRVLAALTNIPLDEESFPYLGLREGMVADVSARVMRVGFVGEWGYEIHVPANSARHVWDALMKAGAEQGIEAFGVEAQRVLRLEKGHIIVGQDTDGLTTPFEADMAWAVKMDKPFFIGQRSLAIMQKKGLKRKLVGFMLDEGYSGDLPKECHLVIRNGEITGRVTSVVDSPSLKRVLGLAYVSIEEAQLGAKFTIRIDGGREISATIVKPQFYDPDGLRQIESPARKKKLEEVA